MKISLLVFSVIIVSFNSYSQEWSWGIKATGDPQNYMAVDMAVDTEGNMILAGYFQENLVLEDFSIYTPDDYFADFYITKINSDKEVEWLKMFETGWCYGDDIAVVVDDDDNIYVTGNIDEKIFVTKFDPDGHQIWHNDFDEQQYGYGRSISLDQFDNVYISGGSGWNFFMSKIDYNGEVLWIRDLPFNSSDAVHITDINVDRLGNIYFIGVFNFETLVLDNFVLEHNGGWGYDTLWGKMDTNGNFIWIKSADGRTNGNPQIALTADGYLFLSGSLYSGITFDGIYIEGICCQNPMPYIAKYDISGNVIWAKEAFTTYQERGTPADIKVNYSGNLYLTGGYFTCSPCTESDIYLEEYDSNGNHLWRKEFVMTTGDGSRAIDIDNEGFAYYVGYNSSETFIDENLFSPTNTLGVAELNTMSSTYKKTPRPQIERNHTICDVGNNITLHAAGSNIKWYSDLNLNNLVFQGNSYNLQVNETLKLYVTQTQNNITSWPKEIIVQVSELDTAELLFEDPIISVTFNPLFNYQWYYLENPITDATNNFFEIYPQTDYMDYGILIKQQDCQIALGNLTLSHESQGLMDGLTMYPNPTKGIIMIESISPINNITIYNNLGQLILSDTNSPLIDITALPKGLYFVKIVDFDENIVIKKVIKE